MRKIEIDRSRASIERLNLLDMAADYGLVLAPESTAPFTHSRTESPHASAGG